MSKKKKWEVFVQVDLTLDEDEEQQEVGLDYEICVIRKDYGHGHRSWGWDEARMKIILFSNHHNPLSDDIREDHEEFKRAKRIAKGLCDVMNKEG